jgi:ADP-ribose pyrophosphatase
MRRNGPWQIESSTTKFTSKLVEVTEHEVIQPDGGRGKYATVCLNRGVAVLAVDDEGVHLTRQFRFAIGRNSVEVVSGAIDAGEEPLDAAKRELREEIGLIAGEWTPLGSIDVDTSILNCRVFMYVARRLEKTQADPDPAEQIAKVTVPIATAVQMVLDGSITHSPSCVTILKAMM